jgi:hypothetical protein
LAQNDSGSGGLRPSGRAGSATSRGALDQTLKPFPSPDTGDQDVRNLPSNGAIPDAAKALIADPDYHVP